MKKLIIAVALTISTSTAIASLSDCEKLGTFSETVMSSRQLGVPLVSVMEVIEGAEGDIMSNIVHDAWTHPIEDGQVKKNQAVEYFKNKQLVDCYRAMTAEM